MCLYKRNREEKAVLLLFFLFIYLLKLFLKSFVIQILSPLISQHSLAKPSVLPSLPFSIPSSSLFPPFVSPSFYSFPSLLAFLTPSLLFFLHTSFSLFFSLSLSPFLLPSFPPPPCQYMHSSQGGQIEVETKTEMERQRLREINIYRETERIRSKENHVKGENISPIWQHWCLPPAQGRSGFL